MTRHEAGLRLEVITPNSLDYEQVIASAHALILSRAKEGHVIERKLEEVKGIAARCAAAYIKSDGQVVAFGGITQEYHKNDDANQPLIAAEFGAMVTAPGYEGNGFGRDVTKVVAETYLDDPQQQVNRTGEFLLFAMADKKGPGRRVFDKLHLPEIPDDALPRQAFNEGVGHEYYNFDLNRLRRERPR